MSAPSERIEIIDDAPDDAPIGLTLGVRAGGRMSAARRAWLTDRLRGRTIGLVGATGAVGIETLALLAEAGVEAARVRAFASPGSVGRRLRLGAGVVVSEHADAAEIAGCDVAILAVGAARAREVAPAIAARGTLVVDHSSAFRQDPGVPLVVPEINMPSRAPAGRIVASPNCTTTIALVAADPIRRGFGVESMCVTSYQAASGAGLAAVSALAAESGAALAGADPAPSVFPVPAAFNVFPHESAIDAVSRANAEEMKVVRESRRIWDDPALAVEATCVRVPVFRTHIVSLRLVLLKPASIAEIERALGASDAIELLDAREPATGVSSLGAAGRCAVLVGRVRPADPTADANAGAHRVVTLVAAGDQLLKGSAWNGLQIAAALV